MSPDAQRIIQNIIVLLEGGTFSGKQAPAVAEALSFLSDAIKLNAPAQEPANEPQTPAQGNRRPRRSKRN